MGASLYGLIVFSMPVGIVVWFIISLSRFVSAKRQNKINPNTFSKSQITTRKVMLIVSSVLFGILVSLLLGFMFYMIIGMN